MNNQKVDISPSASPTVSVIMNCLNCSKYLREAINSVYTQTYTDWEIIFWDNASNDNSAEIAKSYDKRLRYFRGEKTVPLYAARNLALKQAKGKYIAFLDCDDMWLPDKLALQVKSFEENNNVGMIHTNVEILELNGNKRIKHKVIRSSGKIFKELLKDYYINLQSVMISKRALNNLDYWFDESMSVSGDADLFLRISYQWDILYLPEVLARYREHGDSVSASRIIEKIIAEHEKILINLSDRYKGFMSNYKYEASKFRKRAIFSVAIAKWKYTSGVEARRFIAKNLFSSSSFLLLYLLSFLPFNMINYVRNRYLQ